MSALGTFHCIFIAKYINENITEHERQNTDELVLETLNEKIHINLTLSDLDRTHGIGQKKASSKKPRAVIIKFVSHNTRKKVFLNKKLLKGAQVSITESLTVRRVGILKETRGKNQFGNVWTAEGRILYKDGNDNKVKLYYD